MQAIVDNLLTEYEVVGSGQRVLVLPGWGDTAGGWRVFNRALSESYEVLTLNLPGFGGTASPPTAWDLTDYAQFVGHFVEKTGKQPDIIVGHSNGGAVAIRLLATGIIKPKKLILLASAGVRGEFQGRNRTLRLIVKAGKALTAPLPLVAKQRLRRRVYKAIGSDMLVAEHLQATFKKIIADDVREDAGAVMCPTLLIYGTDDHATPVAYGEQLHAKIPGSKLVVLSNAGHFVHIDQLAQVLEQVRSFMK